MASERNSPHYVTEQIERWIQRPQGIQKVICFLGKVYGLGLFYQHVGRAFWLSFSSFFLLLHDM